MTSEILQVNKSIVFYSPIEKDSVLIRTGVLGDGSCLLHSLLHSYSNEYVNMSINERHEFVKKLRVSISKDIDFKKWENLSNGIISKVAFQEKLLSTLQRVYSCIINNDVKFEVMKTIIENDKDLKYYNLIIEMVPLNDFEQKILPQSYEKCNDLLVSEYKKYILETSVSYYSDIFKDYKTLKKNKVQFYINKFSKMVENVVDFSKNQSYNQYINEMKNSQIEIGEAHFGLVSEKFNRDIYIIDYNTKMPYKFNEQNIKKRRSVIVLWVSNCHYEIVGRLKSKNKIQREFSPDDPLIQKFYNYLYRPENIIKDNPFLVPYLPKNVREIKASLINKYSDDSDSDSVISDHSENEVETKEKFKFDNKQVVKQKISKSDLKEKQVSKVVPNSESNFKLKKNMKVSNNESNNVSDVSDLSDSSNESYSNVNNRSDIYDLDSDLDSIQSNHSSLNDPLSSDISFSDDSLSDF